MNMDQVNAYRDSKEMKMRGIHEPNVPTRTELMAKEAQTSHNVTDEVSG